MSKSKEIAKKAHKFHDKTHIKIELALEMLAEGLSQKATLKKLNLHESTLRKYLKQNPEKSEDLVIAKSRGVLSLARDIRYSNDAKAKFLYMSRVHSEFFGRHREENQTVNISAVTRKSYVE